MGHRDAFTAAFSSAFGLGYLPVAPGTWGSAGAAAACWALRQAPAPWSFAIVSVLFVLVLVGGIALAPAAEALYGGKDPGRFVLDEVAGQWLTCLALWAHGPLVGVGAAFVAFRVFDVAKPPPIRRIERLPGGWGVMLDDLAAAVYAALAVWLVGLAAGIGPY